MKTAILLLANGFEEIEAITPADLLRRAGVEVNLVSVEENLLVHGRNDIHVTADMLLPTALEAAPYDAVILPGGPGHNTLRKSEQVKDLVRSQFHAGRLVAAICAAPVVLLHAGILQGHRFTAHETTLHELPDLITDQAVVKDRNLITSRGAGTALSFGLAIVESLFSAEKAREIASSIHAFGLDS
jgi:protein deglycase